MTLAVKVIVVLIALRTVVNVALELLNLSSIRKHSGAVPEMFQSFMDFETYQKSGAYSQAKIKYSVLAGIYSAVVLMALLASGVLSECYGELVNVLGDGVFAQAFAVMAVVMGISIFSIPFEYYEQFVIEQKFGFNKSSVGLWIVDNIKEAVLSVVVGAPILALVLWFTQTFSATWWIWAFAVVAVFQVVMIIVYPMFIVPLFNKLEDLPEGELRTALFDLAKRGKFFAKSIQVIDGSKRSSHSNAYFTGFGKFRRIVLFDTLIAQLEQNELEAVLAHEIGHYRKGHIYKMMFTSFLMMFVMFAFMGYIANCDWFYTQFGFEKSQGMGAVILMCMLFAGFFVFWISPISNYFSRKHEYEADAFASELCNGPEALISALKKLHKKNLGNLTPHKLYSMCNYSHPTLAERMGALNKQENL